MKAHATARYIRQSPYKVRIVLDTVRGLPAEEAQTVLRFSEKRAADTILKVLNSAVANANDRFNLDASDLWISQAYADEGPTLKRWRPRARGRATKIRKRTSHITIVVSDGQEENE